MIKPCDTDPWADLEKDAPYWEKDPASRRFQARTAFTKQRVRLLGGEVEGRQHFIRNGRECFGHACHLHVRELPVQQKPAEIVRIRIYSKSVGYQDFSGPPENAAKNERLAREAVDAYLAAGIEARYVGAV